MALLATNPLIKRRGIATAMTGTDPAFSLPENGSYSTRTLPQGYGFSDLAGYEEARRNQFGQTASADILGTRDKLASSLSDYGQRFFQMQNPAILEDLNSRGLLTSPSAVANSEAQALKEIELGNQNYLRDFDTSALSARLQAQQDALDAGLDLRRGGLEAERQDAQSAREEAMARDLARQQGRNSLNTSLIGAGGTLLGAGLTASPNSVLGRILAGGIGGGTTTAGTTAAASGIPSAAQWATFTGAPGAGAGAGAAPAAGAGGIGLGGAAAIAGAGLGAMALSRNAQNRYGTPGGVLANPIGYQLNRAKEIISNPKEALGRAASTVNRAFGGGHSDQTGSGNATATEQRKMDAELSELKNMKAAVQRGEMTPEQYQATAQPKLDEIFSRVNNLAGKSSAWANAINPKWREFLQSGVVKSVGGGWNDWAVA